MGSSHQPQQQHDIMVLAELDFGQETSDEQIGLVSPSKKNKKCKKKNNGFIANTSSTPSINIDDSDIVTPYQNGHYLNPVTEYAYQNHRPSRARLRHSSSKELEDLELNERNNSTFLSPLPPPLHPHPQSIERVVHSSLSNGGGGVNNAITVAPSRTNLNDSNVFVGGRPTKRPNHRNNHRNNHNRHKGRSRTPDFPSSNHRLRLEEPLDSESILSKIDLSIKNKFGDWDSADEGEVEIARKYLNGHTKQNNLDKSNNRTPYFIPKSVASDSDIILESKDDLNLPRLFKPYENVVTQSRQVLNEKFCLSKDNADPNSILSQAKKTLNLVSGSIS